FGAFVGIVVMVAAFAVEVKWTHAHPPKDRRVEKARELGHIVEAKRAKFWDDAVTPNEQTTSWYHATYVYEISGKQYTYRYRERQYPSTTIKLYYLHSPHRAFHEKKGWSSAHKLL